jgi:hypothetical protein
MANVAKTQARQASPTSEPSAKKVNVFHQRLASLTHYSAQRLLGEHAKNLLSASAKFDIDTERDVFLGGDLYRVRVKDVELAKTVIATITLDSSRKRQLHLNCDHCQVSCHHSAAAIAHLLDARSSMGLAAPPDEDVPLEFLTEDELLRRAIDERETRAKTESMTVRSIDPSTPWTDYIVTSSNSGKTYRVALRGTESGQSYCSCPDFRTNHLGTCKHLIHTLNNVTKKFPAAKLKQPYQRKNVSIRVYYGPSGGLLFNMPAQCDSRTQDIIDHAFEKPITPLEMMNRIQALEATGTSVHVYPDAEELIQAELTQQQLRKLAKEIRKNPQSHPLRKKLLKTELLPYQMDGIAFAVGAGRSVLADDMGLGKTIQGIGVAELLARQTDIRRVLIVCPASLKSQWQNEIAKFSDRSSQLVIGSGPERLKQYNSDDAFFTICNYEQVMRDLTAVEAASWDLIILDEGQRIKNWESKTSQVIRALRSRFALVLSGTPLENRLDELYTVVQFVDDRLLGPAYRFFHRHRMVADNGKAIGYHNLDELRETLKPILLRRRRDDVLKQLPDRTDEVVRIKPTSEQLEISDSQLSIAARIAAKKFLTELDILRLQKALLLARMVADSTYLIDKKEPEYSTKLERLNELLTDLIAEPTRKIVLFSEWRTMLDRIEMKLEQIGCHWVRLDGQVPQKQRAGIVNEFQTNPDCRLILMTNAGSTGLNLQSANTIVNVDLPWNPAVLEQRIARAHRMGQKNPVHVYKLVTEGTIEERLLETLATKQDLADAAIDFDSDVCAVEMKSSIERLKDRLEKMLIQPIAAPIDESQKRRVELEAEELNSRRDRVSNASGQLVGAALKLVGELVAKPHAPKPDDAVVNQLTSSLAESIDRDEAGRPQLKITLENDQALRDLAETLARLLSK